MADIREAYALHLWSQHPVGTVHVRPGPAMAAQDELEARFIGKGGHGALPHAAVDPIVAACQAVLALQTIVARSVDPVQPAVVTVGSLHAGSAPNIIPEDASMRGTLSNFDDGVREILRRRLREVLEGIAAASGCRVEFKLYPGYPAVINDPAAARRVAVAAAAVVGAENVVESPPMAAAEDFAYFLEKVPGAFAFVGAGHAARGIDGFPEWPRPCPSPTTRLCSVPRRTFKASWSGVWLDSLPEITGGELLFRCGGLSLPRAEPGSGTEGRNEKAPVWIGSVLAETLEVDCGDTVRMVALAGEDVAQVGGTSLRDYRVAAVFQIGMYEYDASLALLTLEEAQAFFSLGDRVTGLEVRLEDIRDTEQAELRIQ